MAIAPAIIVTYCIGAKRLLFIKTKSHTKIMFSFFKNKSTGKNKLYAVTVSLGPSAGSSMPSELLGATVVCYVPAVDHLAALQKAAQKLTQDKFVITDIDATVRELNPNKWTEHIKSIWPEFADGLPTQDQVLLEMEAGSIFYSPFCGYDSE